MIDHDNYLEVKAFLRYQVEVMQRDARSVDVDWGWLKHLLRWADDTPLPQAKTIRPVFPQYLLTIRRTWRGGPGTPFTRSGIERACLYARMFFEWARLNLKKYRQIDPAWIQTLRPPRMPIEPRKEHQAVSLEMVRELLAVPVAPGDLATWRDKAAAAFLFLSGMRASAFCTLTVECVDLARRTVMQYPTLGVRTKYNKAAVTALLNIPDLLEAVGEWDSFIRERLPGNAPWYPVIKVSLGEQILTADRPGEYRGQALLKRLARLFERAGLPAMSPHKFRHGHAVYGLKAAHDVSDLKAVSMNLMHSNISITDSIYAVLSDQDVQNRIARLGQGSDVRQDDLESLLRAVLERLTAQR